MKSALDVALEACERLDREQEKGECVSSDSRASETKLEPWPEESLENERRFGYYHARLYPFVERRVWTPAGTGKLYRTGADFSEIVLDSSVRNPDGSENRIRVRTEDVRPIQ